ncbi:hypothetical protein GSI_11005 [Ganoderma sinense ZZ0214-1]|uniref:Uncharacterized protein n=1 Tax=Ganoderma sinense ZZ0214-1 TaxID=1077348 RepID=A0A2G8S272_9APHY|nr:hypothetical protein GSI_11005 [Ganoderma sinense ZZ0214-1]
MDTISSTVEPRGHPSARVHYHLHLYRSVLSIAPSLARHTWAHALDSVLHTITLRALNLNQSGLASGLRYPSRFKPSVMSPQPGFYRALPAEAHARQVDPATRDPDVLVRIPQVQASSSFGAPIQPSPPQDGSPFPPTTTSPPVPIPPLSESLERVTLAERSSSSTTTLVRRASSSDPSPGAIVAIVAGVTLFFVVVAMLLHLQEMKAFCQNLITRIRRWGLATPAKDRQWDVLSWNEASALASTEASTPEPFPNPPHTHAHTARMRDVSIHLVSTAEQHASLPPLQPNRRPPSSVIDPAVNVPPPEPAPPLPLPRLEPLRRKPSKSKVSRPPALVLPSRESTPPETPPKDPPPLPSPAPSSTSASGSGSASASEKRTEPSVTETMTTTTTTTARLAIQMPKPVRGDLRPISAYTSASTTLSEMPLLKPSTRPHPHEGKDARLSRVLTVANPGDAHSPGGVMARPVLPPIPPVPPIPPIYLPKLAAEREREKEAPRPLPLPAKPLASLSRIGNGNVNGGGSGSGNKPLPTRTDSQSTTLTLSPTSPGSPPLRRQNSASSSRSPRSPLRKPVPPLVLPLAPARHSRSTSEGEPEPEPEDVGSSFSIWAPESGGWRKNSLASTALSELAGSRWGSPVPSSSASQMYRTRDSGLSEWTWTRPLEDWEKEQMDLRRKASAGELSPPHAYRSLGGVGGTMGGGGGGGGRGGGGWGIRRARAWVR